MELYGLWISAAVRCAPPQNKPSPDERDTCLPYAARELELLPNTRVVLCLGAFAWDAALRLYEVRPKPKFGHGVEYAVGGITLLGCYHVSQQNTFTGVLTPEMLDAVLRRARELGGLSGIPSGTRNRPGPRKTLSFLPNKSCGRILPVWERYVSAWCGFQSSYWL